MKTIKGLVFILLLVCAIMLPTSAYASDKSTDSITQYGSLQTFSLANIFTFFNKDYKAADYHEYSWNNDGYHDRYDDDHHDDGDGGMIFANGGTVVAAVVAMMMNVEKAREAGAMTTVV